MNANKAVSGTFNTQAPPQRTLTVTPPSGSGSGTITATVEAPAISHQQLRHGTCSSPAPTRPPAFAGDQQALSVPDDERQQGGLGNLHLLAPETALLAFIVRAQGPVPVQSPLQPAKLEPAAGLAVSVTAVPSE